MSTTPTFAHANITIDDNVMGIVCQNRDHADDGIVYMTPGVHLDCQTDGKDQKYRDCETAIVKQNCDVVIVGRGISEAKCVIDAAKRYRNAAWTALLTK